MGKRSGLASATCVIMMLALFCVLCLSRFHHIHGEVEITGQMGLIRTLFQDWYTHADTLSTSTPHLYALIQWGVAELFGQVNSFTLRLTNLFFWLGTLGLSAIICRRYSWRWLLLYCVTSPLFIACVTIIDIGSGLLPLCLLLLLYAAEVWTATPSRWLSNLSLSFSLALCCWCDPGTVFLLVPCLMGWSWLHHRWHGLIRMGAMVLIGLAFFGISWGLYGHYAGIRWWLVYDELPWVGCLLGSFLGTVYCLWQSHHQSSWHCPNIYLASGLWLLVAQLLVVGMNLNWTACLLVLFIGLWQCIAKSQRYIASSRPDWRLVSLGILAFLLWVLAVGDPLLIARTDLGASWALRRPILGAVSSLAGRLTGFIALMALIIWWTTYRHNIKPVASLFTVLIALHLGTLILQATGDYQSGTVYGDRKDIRLCAAWIREHGYTDKSLLAPIEVLESLGQISKLTTAAFRLEDIESDKALILTNQPSLIVLSWLTQSPSAIRSFLQDENIQELLKNYKYRQLGQVLLWTRKGEQRKTAR